MSILDELPTEGVEVVEREHPDGLLRFENYPAGTWLTKAGQPAKKDRRQYTLDGAVMDSVSSIVGTLDKPALMYWIEDQASRGAVEAERLGELQDCPPEEIMHRVKALGLGASAARDEGAARGHAIHAAFEALALNGSPPNPADYPEDWRPYVQGCVRAWLALDATAVRVEHMVCNLDGGYAGRLDLIADTPEGLTLTDYKTGRGRVYDAAHYQTRLYEMALRAEGILVDRVVIVGIDGDGGFQLVDCEATEEDALALLHTFHSRKRINAGMAAQRKAAKAAAKAAA